MSHTTFRTAYDCLTLRQAPLALNLGTRGVSVGQHRQPAGRHAALAPVADTGRAQAEGAGEIAEAFLTIDGFLEDIHTHDFTTSVSAEGKNDSRLHCHNTNMSKISERLKEARLLRGWSQVQLAIATGLSPGTIGNIESGVRQGKGSLPQIAKALGISHDWLANGIGEMGMTRDAPEIASEGPTGPSSQAALLALLFDKLQDDVVLRATVFNKASQIIINTIQGTDEQQPQQTREQAAQKTVKKQSA